MYYIFKEESTYHLFRQIKIQYFVYYKSKCLSSSWGTLEQCIQDFSDYMSLGFLEVSDSNTKDINLAELLIQGKELVGAFDYIPTMDNIIEFNPEVLL